MPACCLCYVVDEGYLFPTLVSASQAKRHISPGLAAVAVVCIGGIRRARAAVLATAQRHDILLIEVDRADIRNMHAMWGRMFLHQILPAEFQCILYLDGDTQIARSLDPLFTYDLPKDRILVTRDPSINFGRLSPRWQRKIEAHCTQIGYTRPCTTYFNSGLLLFHRSEWAAIAEACLAVYREQGARFVHPDQDALNIAVPERALLISERWNFPGFLMNTPAEQAIQPHIYHFFSNPRPWLVAAPPWGERGARPYREMLTAEPALAAVAPSYSPGRRLRYQLQQRVKMVTEYGRVGRIAGELPVDVVL